MKLDGTSRVVANQATPVSLAPSDEDFRKELLALLETASVEDVVDLLKQHKPGELGLSGLHLSIDGFTTLTLALPQSRVTRLRLASCGITDNYPVATLLDERSTLAALDLSSNQLTSRSAKFIGSCLGRNGKLVSLDLSYNQLDHTAFCSIMRFVCASQGKQAANQTLQVLNFQGNCNGKMFGPLYEHLRTRSARSPANERAWKDFANLGVPPRLILLDLSNTGVMADDPALIKLVGDTSLSLDLDGNASGQEIERGSLGLGFGVDISDLERAAGGGAVARAGESGSASARAAETIATAAGGVSAGRKHWEHIASSNASSQNTVARSGNIAGGGKPRVPPRGPIAAAGAAPIIDPHTGGVISQSSDPGLQTAETAVVTPEENIVPANYAPQFSMWASGIAAEVQEKWKHHKKWEQAVNAAPRALHQLPDRAQQATGPGAPPPQMEAITDGPILGRLSKYTPFAEYVSPQFLEKLAAELPNCQEVTSIEFEKGLGPNHVEGLMNVLKNARPSLRYIGVWNGNLRGCMWRLAEAWTSSPSSSVSVLGLYKVSLEGTDAAALFRALAGARGLAELYLGGNPIFRNANATLFSAIKPYPHLLLLDLTQTHFEHGLDAGQGFLRLFPNLKHLQMGDVQVADERHVKKVIDVILSCDSLQEVSLPNWTGIGGFRITRALFQPLLDRNIRCRGIPMS